MLRGRDTVQNSRVDPQLQVIERFGELITAYCQENLCCHLEEDSREICLRFHSKGERVWSFTHSHAPLQGQDRYNLISFIGQFWETLNPARKHIFSGGIGRGFYGGQSGWNPQGDHGFHGITRTVTLPGAALDAVLEIVDPA